MIGLTFCPGKKHAGSYAGDWDRDLSADLQAIRMFGAKALVTLMEPHELRAVQVPMESLASRAREYGLEWHHLPIRDADIPGEDFEDRWTYSGPRLRTLLNRGERIVIHCRGGLGRTGTVAGRLLVEFGESPQHAVRAIRHARPGSIETPSQELYLTRCAPVTLGPAPTAEERALACMLGGAVGDAFGYAVEFFSLPEIRKRFGEKGIQTPVAQGGKLTVSDDTQMTLFTLEGLLKALAHGERWREACLPSIRIAYLNWLRTQTNRCETPGSGWLAAQPVMQARRAPGNTCLSALGAGGRGTIQKPINDSKGCSGVMRVAPIGLVGDRAGPQEIFQVAAESAALTHGHPSGYLSAGVMACLTYLLVQGTDLKQALEKPHDFGRLPPPR